MVARCIFISEDGARFLEVLTWPIDHFKSFFRGFKPVHLVNLLAKKCQQSRESVFCMSFSKSCEFLWLWSDMFEFTLPSFPQVKHVRFVYDWDSYFLSIIQCWHIVFVILLFMVKVISLLENFIWALFACFRLNICIVCFFSIAWSPSL